MCSEREVQSSMTEAQFLVCFIPDPSNIQTDPSHGTVARKVTSTVARKVYNYIAVSPLSLIKQFRSVVLSFRTGINFPARCQTRARQINMSFIIGAPQLSSYCQPPSKLSGLKLLCTVQPIRHNQVVSSSVRGKPLS